MDYQKFHIEYLKFARRAAEIAQELSANGFKEFDSYSGFWKLDSDHNGDSKVWVNIYYNAYNSMTGLQLNAFQIPLEIFFNRDACQMVYDALNKEKEKYAKLRKLEAVTKNALAKNGIKLGE